MDFDDYTLKLASIEEGLLAQLLRIAYTQIDDPGATRYFTASVNPGLRSASRPGKYSELDVPIQTVVNKLAHVFKPEQYTSCEVNFLEAGADIREHTDQSSAVTGDGINHKFGCLVNFWHTVHVPLIGVGTYRFRRDKRNQLDVRDMMPGEVYLYNNHVMHSVVNNLDTVRVNMILHFHDPDWTSKKLIYKHYGLKGFY
jgi:hypothetical protein